MPSRTATTAAEAHPAQQCTTCSPPSQRLLRGSSAGQEQLGLDSGLAFLSPAAAAFQAASQRESLWAMSEQPTREVQSTGKWSYLRRRMGGRANGWAGRRGAHGRAGGGRGWVGHTADRLGCLTVLKRHSAVVAC